MWELTHAWDGYAASKGIKNQTAPPVIPSEAARKALRARVEREARGRSG